MNHALVTLQERGFLQQCTDLEGLSRLMDQGPVTFYVGADPTGPSLHIGHMVPFFAMRHLRSAGHRAIALIGGGTARIGDPSGKTEMRRMITYDQIQENADRIAVQLDRFVGFDGKTAFTVNNVEWLSNLNYIDFLRDIGVHFSVNRMLSFEAYRKRMETGLTFIEFNYQLLQSFDFLELYRRHECRLQIGGDDQWGNIVAGLELIRRVEGAETFGLTFPLVTTADGKKMGKTEQGALFLDPSITSPYDFFQYWRNIPDADVERFLLMFTFLPAEECRQLGSARDAEINRSKERLAFEVTKLIHGKEEAGRALAASHAAFSAGADGASGDLSGIPSSSIPAAVLAEGMNVLDLFASTSLCGSKSDARRLVAQGGAVVNDRRIEDIGETVDDSWLRDGALLLRAGKKRYFRVIAE